MRRPYLAASLLLSTAFFASTATAQNFSSGDVPGPNNAGDIHDLTGKTPYTIPDYKSPQPESVNPAHLPDIEEIPANELPQAVPQESSAPKDADWPAYGRDAQESRYSPLKEITPQNAAKLQRAFVYHTGSLPPKNKPNKWAPETTPIKVGDSLYLCSAMNDMMRLDAKTGKELWHYKAGVHYESIPYTAACKSVVYYTSSTVPEGQECHHRILEATLDERLIEVDAETGKTCPMFGHDGQVNLMQGMGWSVPGFVSVTAPPPIINGVIVVNHEILDGQRRWSPSGVIRGYDAESGKFVWAWDVNNPTDHHQPAPGKFYSRGTPNSWAAMTGDNDLGLVYVPTGNSTVDYYSALRSPKENEVSSSVVAIDVKTGEPRWVFQTTHKDVWDYDIGSQATLFTYHSQDGEDIPALIMPTKRGQTFILDRRTGQPLKDFPVVERAVPKVDYSIPGDTRSPTQPWSIGVPRFGFPELTEADTWGMSPLDHLLCRIKFRKANYKGEFTPPSLDKPWIEYPGYNGGSDWGSISYNPETGILVANWNNTPMYDQLVTRPIANKIGLVPVDSPDYTPSGGGAEGNGAQVDTPFGIVVSPFWNKFTGLMCNVPPYGMISAIDLKNHKVLWQKPIGTARANGPWGLATGLPLNIGTPNNGGPITTAGGLIFVAAATDNLIRAIDIKTGEVVWSDVLPGGGQTTPMTYEVDGHQYVAIVAGGHHMMQTPISDQLIVYALPDAIKK